MQFDGVTLRSDSQPHPFTIGGQQDRLNPHPTLVSNRHQHRSLISWLFGENGPVGVARIRCSLWLGTWPTRLFGCQAGDHRLGPTQAGAWPCPLPVGWSAPRTWDRWWRVGPVW